MSKHPHRLMLNQKKTWRCTLKGCRYFIHLGLAHTLPGQQSICWGCGSEFTLDEIALNDDMPKCDECRSGKEGRLSLGEIGEITEMKLALSKAGVNSIDELSPEKFRTMKMLGVIPKHLTQSPKPADKDDEIEVDEG